MNSSCVVLVHPREPIITRLKAACHSRIDSPSCRPAGSISARPRSAGAQSLCSAVAILSSIAFIRASSSTFSSTRKCAATRRSNRLVILQSWSCSQARGGAGRCLPSRWSLGGRRALPKRARPPRASACQRQPHVSRARRRHAGARAVGENEAGPRIRRIEKQPGYKLQRADAVAPACR
jgi:hypothetical protein